MLFQRRVAGLSTQLPQSHFSSRSRRRDRDELSRRNPIWDGLRNTPCSGEINCQLRTRTRNVLFHEEQKSRFCFRSH